MGIVMSLAISCFICAILVMVLITMNRNKGFVGTRVPADYVWKAKASRPNVGHRLRRIAAVDLPREMVPDPKGSESLGMRQCFRHLVPTRGSHSVDSLRNQNRHLPAWRI
jgi:hypothetical protein